MSQARRPPRLLVRMLAMTFVTALVLLGATFAAIVFSSHSQLRRTVRAHLESSQQMVAALQARELRGLRVQAGSLAESPTIKAVMDTYAAESKTADASVREQLLNTLTSELRKIAARVDADAVVAVDTGQETLAAAGRLANYWPIGSAVRAVVDPFNPDATDGVLPVQDGLFQLVAAPLTLSDGSIVGTLYLATSLDRQFIGRLAALAGTETAIVRAGALVASTLTSQDEREFEQALPHLDSNTGTIAIGGESHAFRRLMAFPEASVYALASIDQSARTALGDSTRTLMAISLGALALSLVGSFGLAHLLSRPIGHLSATIHSIARSREFGSTLPRSGSSQEIDTLTDTFNELMGSVAAAEQETKAAYTAAIRALAATLDARDPYTAGHSERVSAVSMAVGRVLRLPADEIEVLRLGALLHDIGKIGVPDGILQKPGPLTAAEYATLQRHPTLGAHILGTVPFLASHVPIVELHHERPDGRGYPHGLRGEEIPLAARIVHVADAYDAMTSARAYRPERPSADALRELWICAGTQFDEDIVAALTTALEDGALTGLPDEPLLEGIGA